MKRIIVLLLLTNLIWLNSCSHVLDILGTVISDVWESADERDSKLTRVDLMNHEYQREQDGKLLMLKLITAINAQDAETIKNMFAVNALEQIDSFDVHINDLFQYVHGNIDMPQKDKIHVYHGGTSVKNGEITESGNCFIVNIKTNLDWDYSIAYWYVSTYNNDNDNIGVHRISVNKIDHHVKNTTSTGYPWSNNYLPGLSIPSNDVLTGDLFSKFEYVYKDNRLYKYYLDEMFTNAGLTEEEISKSIVHEFDVDLNGDGCPEKMLVLRSAVHCTVDGQMFQILQYDENSNMYTAIAEQPLLLEDLESALRIGKIYLKDEKNDGYLNVYYQCTEQFGVFKYNRALQQYVFEAGF